MSTPQLAHIQIFPVKSLDAVVLTEAQVGRFSLLHDRSFAMKAEDGRYVNGKRTGRVNELKADFDLEKGEISLGERGGEQRETFELREGNIELEGFLSDFFQMPVQLVHSANGDLMDIPGQAALTVLSRASLEALQTDIPGHSLDNMRLRFRATLELEGVEAFWEDRLFGSPGTGRKFRIGEVEAIGIAPRERCSVPPRDPLTGLPDKKFARQMMASREKHLPIASALAEYGHFYRLAVDVFLPESESGKTLRVGDPIELLEYVDLHAG